MVLPNLAAGIYLAATIESMWTVLFSASAVAETVRISVEAFDGVGIVDLPHRLFLFVDKHRLHPPSTHFLTQAAPDPACLAPHIESEIQH